MWSAGSVVASPERLPPASDPALLRALLRRDPLPFGDADELATLRDRCVLITGAGGSIGSALARAAARDARRVVALDRSETGLGALGRDLRATHPALDLRLVLADIGDRTTIVRLLDDVRPELILHCAAHKHLPLLEQQPLEALRNNLLATATLADAAVASGVATFLLLSTDKAAAPISVLGASKRAAEMHCCALAGRSSTRFVVLRSGNVLGSSGSVLEVFMAQLARAEPLTVSHRDARRFMLTVDECVAAVLRTLALAADGDLLVVDAGDPIRIEELARRLIRHLGSDIGLRDTALHAGEKLSEVLTGPDEVLVPTAVPSLMLVRARAVTDAPDLALAREAIRSGSEAAGYRALAQLVPGYARPGADPE